MWKVIKKDITSIASGIIVHGVNCQGKMGAGVALAIKNKWPIVYYNYKDICKKYHNNKNELLGQLQPNKINDNLIVYNLFSQLNYGRDVGRRYADIDCIYNGLETIRNLHKESIIHMPQIGCGLGGLNFQSDLIPVLNKLFNNESDVLIYSI